MKVYSYLFPKNFTCLVLAFSFMINLIFVSGIKYSKSFFIFCMRMSSCPASFVDKTIDFPLNCLDALLESQLITPRVYFWVLKSVCWSICPPSSNTTLPYGLYCLKLKNVNPPMFFPQDCFWLDCIPCISLGFWISWSIYWKR